MSRIGKLPISLPQGVQVQVRDDLVCVKGPKGTLEQALPTGIAASVDADNRLVVTRRNDSKTQKALHGLSRALLANAVKGVTDGFTKILEIHGIGYRAELKGKSVAFSLGYTHPVEYPIPGGIDIAVDRNTKITVSGIDRQKVGQVAAEIRALRRPDVYKQKGIRYEGEALRQKAGKTGA